MDVNEIIFLINERNNQTEQLNKLILSMNLMVNAHKKTFHSLAEKLLQQLEKEIDIEKIKAIIESELCVTFGLYLNEFNSDKIADNIISWWENL